MNVVIVKKQLIVQRIPQNFEYETRTGTPVFKRLTFTLETQGVSLGEIIKDVSNSSDRTTSLAIGTPFEEPHFVRREVTSPILIIVYSFSLNPIDSGNFLKGKSGYFPVEV